MRLEARAVRWAVVGGAFFAASEMYAAAAAWTVDKAHSSIRFSVSHGLFFEVPGAFANFEGTVAIDEADVTKSKVDITVFADSVNTNNADRDEHLRSDDFLKAAKFPKMTFQSTGITKGADGKLKLEGNMTIAGSTQKVTFAVDGPSPVMAGKDKDTRGAKAVGTIDRTKFGIVWNKALDKGGMVVGNDVKLEIVLGLAKAK